MRKKQTLLWIFSALFIGIEITLGVLLQISSGRTAELFSFGAVVLCFLFCFFFFDRSKEYIFTQTALLFTVGADYCLVYSRTPFRVTAMCFFLVVQTAYFARLYISDESAVRRKWQIITHAIGSVLMLAVTVFVLGEKTDVLSAISMLYYINLILNLVFAFTQWKKNPVFAIGLLLFILCDTVVGLGVLEEYFSIAEDSMLYRVIEPGFNLAWAFYLPSQVLLTLSLLCTRFHKEKSESFRTCFL